MRRDKSILQKDMSKCYICGKPGECTHEVFFGTANRKKSIEWGCYVKLCNHCHNMSNESVHMDHTIDVRLKQEMQSKFEELYGHDKFMTVFGRSWL